MKTKHIPLAVLCLAAIAASGVWVYRTQFAAPKFNVALHQGLGRAMAEQTARVLEATGRVVIVTLEPETSPELRVQVQEFEKALRQYPGLAIKETYCLETDDKPKYGFGAGLSARRYVRIVNKNRSADAIVSFVGAPDLSKDDMEELKKVPKFIAECRSADKLKRLFELKAIHTAVVSRFQYPSPFKGTPRTPADWVAQRFQIVTPQEASTLPKSSSD